MVDHADRNGVFSAYLTDAEWDACFYARYTALGEDKDFGAVMHALVEKLLAKGYVFGGLDPQGVGVTEIPSTNMGKLTRLLTGEITNSEVMEILGRGRVFLKEHFAELLLAPGHTDADWDAQLADLKTKGMI